MADFNNFKRIDKHIRKQYEEAIKISKKKYDCVFGYQKFEELYLEAKRVEIEKKKKEEWDYYMLMFRNIGSNMLEFIWNLDAIPKYLYMLVFYLFILYYIYVFSILIQYTE